ncbi:DEAD/DEAH box helicase family protein [Nocardiopsis sp. NRRL B-16309]|uniref:DEAD/DEAH box helicase family protein n=1 Tax=Nocardiopsis sp. NRRL B-16309 TaxID=1519494 RepID=UPI0006B06648|nr:DEAD/DEAH box helicase family protein [Nocardiopsis sp. NRRL B-16309]
MSNFDFLRAEWPDLHNEAIRAERLAVADPRVSCFYARRTLELAVNWLYEADDTLRTPYQSDLAARIAEPTMVNLVGPAIRTKMDLIRRQGNAAVHRPGPVSHQDSTRTAVELFHVLYWLARHYTRTPDNAPASGLSFKRDVIPTPVPAEVRRKKQAEVQKMAEDFARQQDELAKAQRRNKDLDAEVLRLRAQVKEAKAANATVPDQHDYNEADTRTHIIDLLLREAGWVLTNPEDREYPLTGLPTSTGEGRADYVLWDDNGRPLAVVEAKRTTKDARDGQQQAKAYADALEAKFGQRPVIFCTSGYRTFVWDDHFGYPPREVHGFYTKDELRTLIMRRAGRQALAGVEINADIAGRHYQARAIRRIAETFADDKQRQALLVMATGAGKTRTVIALVDLLNRAGWIKRVLFLADRTALVNQALGAFKQHLPSTPVVNLVEEKNTEARVYVSTYPTMMGLINDASDEVRKFGPGYFDLVVIDEAHRSVYQKYGAIFEYFDALLVGLTATPKDEIDRNTYRLFHLEDGVPTDVYSLDEAIQEKYLVGPTTIDVPLKFPREGIKYDELSEEDQEAWDLTEWDDDEGAPDEITADEVNKHLFNKDTIDKALQTVMAYGAKVEGGDRLGKTIVFARNTKHAHFIVERFNDLYPDLGGDFAQVITHNTSYAQATLDKFSRRDSPPYIAVSVDMLDTGVDIPEVVNLVFAKLVRSKTKFWQMIGRGTRLCPDLFGPGDDKSGFLVFDMGRNVEFFNQNLPAAEGRTQPSLRERVFRKRVELLHGLDSGGPAAAETGQATTEQATPEAPGSAPAAPGTAPEEPADEPSLRRSLAERLQSEVAGMNHRNVEVRRQLERVEAYQDPAAWQPITADKRDELIETLAPLPTEFKEDENSQEAKRFDLLALRLQLGVLEPEPGFDKLRQQVQDIAEALLDPTTINNPVVAKHRELLADLATDAWWEDVTLPMLELMRRRVRGLVRLIPKTRRGIVYSDFEDELGELTETELRDLDIGGGWTRFELKVRTYVHSHGDDLSVQKLLRNRQLTSADIDHFTRVFLDGGFGTEGDIERAEEEHGGLGLFLRSLTGLERDAVAAAFDEFQAGHNLTGTELHFLKLIIDYVAKNGFLDVGDLYEPPFTSVSPSGPEGVFGDAKVDAIQEILNRIKATAIPPEAAAG